MELTTPPAVPVKKSEKTIRSETTKVFLVIFFILSLIGAFTVFSTRQGAATFSNIGGFVRDFKTAETLKQKSLDIVGIFYLLVSDQDLDLLMGEMQRYDGLVEDFNSSLSSLRLSLEASSSEGAAPLRLKIDETQNIFDRMNGNCREMMLALMNGNKKEGAAGFARVQKDIGQFKSLVDEIEKNFTHTMEDQVSTSKDLLQKTSWVGLIMTVVGVLITLALIYYLMKFLSITLLPISNLMHNLRQAVFSIDRNAKVVAPVSRYTDSVFGGSILDQKILSVLFNEGKVKNEIVAKMDFVFNACLGADEAQWVLAEGYLPAELSVRRAGRDKLLKMSYTPLYDRNKLVQNIMIVAEDITEMKALRQAAAQQQTEIAVIKAFLEMGRSEIVPLLDDCSEKVAKSRALFSNLLSAEDATLELSRVLHTLKGNARMYAFHLLAGHIHELEQHLEEWADARKEEDVDGADKLHQQMSSELQTVQKEVKSYYLIASKFLGDGDIVDGAGAPSSVFRGLAPMVERLAKGLEKQIQFIYEIQGIDESLSTLGRERVQSLKDALIHMVRNSVDHGIESAEERVALNKDRLGVISVKVWVASEHELRLTVSDDGRGVDSVGLAAKAVERGMLDPEEAALLSEQERVELMFRPNLSIKETASLISGRGVGMDAVKDSLQRLGGSISVESRAGQGTTFEMSVPVA